jgi:colanic acid/amylovoran biosynthesis glycosyltransferase
MGGGAEIVSAEVYRRLAPTHEFSITVLTGVPGATETSDPAGPDTQVLARRGVDLSRLLGAQLSVAPGVVADAVRQVRHHRPDVIHASSIHFFGSIVAAAAAQATGIPLVTTGHLAGLDALPPKTQRAAALYERTVGRYIVGRSTRLIAVAQGVADHLVSIGAPSERVRVVENGVDAKRFTPGTRSLNEPVITFVGRLIDNKGPLMLIDAFCRLDNPQVRLQIVGEGPLRDTIQARAADDPRIRVLGHRDDVHTLLGESDVFVRPSTTEGRSLAVLEAMAAGCAVVATDIPANAELVTRGIDGLLTPIEDLGALAANLELLVNDPALRTRLGAAARKTAVAASWETTASQTGDVLAEAAEAGRR